MNSRDPHLEQDQRHHPGYQDQQRPVYQMSSQDILIGLKMDHTGQKQDQGRSIDPKAGKGRIVIDDRSRARPENIDRDLAMYLLIDTGYARADQDRKQNKKEIMTLSCCLREGEGEECLQVREKARKKIMPPPSTRCA